VLPVLPRARPLCMFRAAMADQSDNPEKRPDTDRDAPDVTPGKKPKRGTLGWLAEEASTAGSDGVMRALSGKFARGAGDLAPYAVIPAGGGREAKRNDLNPDDVRIRYLDFSAPAVWAPTYTVLRVDVERETDPAFMFHAGEELLFPVDGAVEYNFAQSRNGDVDALQIVTIGENEGIRINPQLPHRARSTRAKSSRVWMVLRYANDSARKVISTDTRLYAPVKKLGEPRTLTLDELRSPATYALIAWGLSEMIRVHRQRADLSVDQLADACSVDATLLSRIEAVQKKPRTEGVNISLDALLRLSEFLSLPLPDLIWQALQMPFDKACLLTDASRRTSSKIEAASVLGGPWLRHELHVASIRVPAGSQHRLPAKCAFPKGVPASWVIVRGTVTVDMDVTDSLDAGVAAYSATNATATEGSVIHFRSATPTTVTAHTPAQIIQIVRSTDCRCKASVAS
jgi:transcriptional regulator with XRE-family HTH domain